MAKGNNKQRKICSSNTCKKGEQTIINFYATKNKMFTDGKMPICKTCIKEMINYNDIKTIHTLMRQLDIPFLIDLWEKCEEGKTDTLGTYIRQLNSLPQYATMTWDDSVFEYSNNENKTEEENKSKRRKNPYEIDEDSRYNLIDKWGLGYSDDELYLFEKKYNLLKNNYPEKTALHRESLLTYIRYRVKEEISTARGDVAEAQKWGALADKASEKAKINPNQLSKADLSGGLNGFGELSRAVEKAVDMYEILPRFKERPQDKVDFTLWCYINYCRRLKNLPDASYKEIWKFYDDRKEEYKQKDTDREFEFEDEK